MNSRDENRARHRANKLPEGMRLIDETAQVGHEWTQGEAASQLGIHRTVLYRMEERGELPKPRWRRKNSKGNPYRVYNAKEIENIKKILEDKASLRDAGRQYVED